MCDLFLFKLCSCFVMQLIIEIFEKIIRLKFPHLILAFSVFPYVNFKMYNSFYRLKCVGNFVVFETKRSIKGGTERTHVPYSVHAACNLHIMSVCISTCIIQILRSGSISNYSLSFDIYSLIIKINTLNTRRKHTLKCFSSWILF